MEDKNINNLWSKLIINDNFGNLFLGPVPIFNNKVDVNVFKFFKDNNIKYLCGFMPESELKELGISYNDLLINCEKYDIVYKILPILNMSVLNNSDFSLWEKYLPVLLKAIKNKENIAMHCRYGYGRAGTMAAIFLIELGFSAKEAISIVKKARKGVISNAKQLNFIYAYVCM